MTVRPSAAWRLLAIRSARVWHRRRALHLDARIMMVLVLSMPVVTVNAATNPAPAPKKKTVAAKPAPAVRTLDAIRIEGEIDVPQVLFITARDYRRFRDGTPARYQTTSADIAKSVPLPNRVRVVAPVK